MGGHEDGLGSAPVQKMDLSSLKGSSLVFDIAVRGQSLFAVTGGGYVAEFDLRYGGLLIDLTELCHGICALYRRGYLCKIVHCIGFC